MKKTHKLLTFVADLYRVRLEYSDSELRAFRKKLGAGTDSLKGILDGLLALSELELSEATSQSRRKKPGVRKPTSRRPSGRSEATLKRRLGKLLHDKNIFKTNRELAAFLSSHLPDHQFNPKWNRARIVNKAIQKIGEAPPVVAHTLIQGLEQELTNSGRTDVQQFLSEWVEHIYSRNG